MLSVVLNFLKECAKRFCSFSIELPTFCFTCQRYSFHYVRRAYLQQLFSLLMRYVSAFKQTQYNCLIGHSKHIHKHQDRIYCNQIFIKPIQQNLLMEQLIRHQKQPCKGVRFQVLLCSSCFITCCRIQHRTIFYIALVCIFHIAVDMI